MSIRGPEALASLEEAMRDIRREEDEISRRLARTAEKIGKIKESEAELFRQLAQLRLDPAIQGELDGRISTAETKARAMLKSHARDVETAEQTIKDVDVARAALVEQRKAANERFEDLQGQLKALNDRQVAALADDAAFQAKRSEAEELDRVAEQSMRKTEQAETDREEKGRPYRDDPLFMYLWEAGYGTSNYRANNLIRYFDGMVASLVGFQKARPNFAMLNEIPMRLREHAERQEANAQAAEAELEALQLAAVDAAGGKPIRAALAAAQAEIEKIDAQIVECEDKRDTAAKTLQDLAEGRDPAFENAASTLAEALGREDIQTLLAQARLTRTGQDDTIVAQIDEARARIREEDEESREQRERLKTLAARRRELVRASARTSWWVTCSTTSCAAASPRPPTGTIGAKARTGPRAANGVPVTSPPVNSATIPLGRRAVAAPSNGPTAALAAAPRVARTSPGGAVSAVAGAVAVQAAAVVVAAFRVPAPARAVRASIPASRPAAAFRLL